MPQIIVEFVPDYSKVQSATDQLAGDLSQPVIEEFKKVQQSIDQTANAAGGSLGKLSANTKGIAEEMAKGMKDGLKDGLKAAAVQMEKDLKRITDSFKSVAKSGDLNAINAQLKTFLAALKTEQRPEVIKAYTAAIGDLEKEVEQLNDNQDKTAKSTKTLKQELRELTAAIAGATLEGKNSGPEFQAMVDRAGEIKDAMGDAASQINTFASDTAKLDETIGVVTGVAAAFSVAQGAVALLGDDNEELQESMQRLQASMAILNGLQEISNLLERQSAAYKGITRIQTLAGVAATNLETAAQSRNIIIKGAAAIAQRGLNLVMAANPAFLLVAIFATLGAALVAFTSKTETAADRAKKLNEEFQKELDYLNAVDNALSEGRDKLISKLEAEITVMQARGASTTDILKKEKELTKAQADRANQSAGFFGAEVDRIGETAIEIENLTGKLNDLTSEINTNDVGWVSRKLFGSRGKKDIQEDIDTVTGQLTNLQKQQELAISKRDAAQVANTALAAKQAEIEKKALEDALKSAAATAEARVLQVKEGTEQELKLRIAALQAQRTQELSNVNLTAGERLKIEAQTLKSIQTLRFEFEKRLLEDRRAAIEASVDSQLEGSEAEFKARGALIRAQLDVDLKNNQLSANQRIALMAKAEKAITQLERERNTKLIEDQAFVLQAQLDLIKGNAVEQEKITVDLLNKQRELELSQVINNRAKEKEINARFDKEISAQRLAIRQQEFSEQIALEDAQGATRKRRLESFADDENAGLAARLLAIREVERVDTASVQKRMQNNEDLFKSGLITEIQYKTELARLKDEEAQIHENAEKRKTDATVSESEKRKNKFKEEALEVLNAVEQIIGSFNAIAQAFADRAAANIEGQKRELDQLKEAGAITEKEFIARQKRLEAAELAAKRRAAVREKAVALFTAGIQGARAIIEAAPNPVMIALTAALVAAQLISIASKPIPKFSRGSKHAPRGFAEVAETGAEVIKDDKGYHLVEHPQIVWLKGGEQIYNPKETRDMFSHETPLVKADLTKPQVGGSGGPAIDYKKLTRMFGDEIARHPRNIINLDQNGFSQFTIDRMNKTRYLNKRYTFNG